MKMVFALMISRNAVIAPLLHPGSAMPMPVSSCCVLLPDGLLLPALLLFNPTRAWDWDILFSDCRCNALHRALLPLNCVSLIMVMNVKDSDTGKGKGTLSVCYTDN